MVQLQHDLESVHNKGRVFRVQFLINGDRFFSGLSYLIRSDRINFEILCQDLSRVLVELKSLPSGVRYIFDSNGQRVYSIENLEENGFYYCSSSRLFVGIYPSPLSESDATTTASGQSSSCSFRGERLANSLNGFISRVVAIVPGAQTGRSSRQIVRFLLTHRVMHKFDTLLNELSKLGLGAIYHVYALSTQKKMSFIEDFFHQECIYLVYGRHNRFSPSHFVFKLEEKVKLQTILGTRISPLKVRDSVKQNQILQTDAKTQMKSICKNFRVNFKRRPTLPHIDLVRETFVSRFLSCQETPSLDYSKPPNKIDRTKAWACARQFMPRSEIHALYEKRSFLGEGKFGLVFKCYSRAGRRPFAMKVVNKLINVPPQHKNFIDLVNEEGAIHSRVEHENILKMYKLYEYRQEMYMILEWCPAGDLLMIISKFENYPLPENVVAEIMSDILNALVYLHSLCIVHRDIKPENLMVKWESSYEPHRKRLRIKVGDFGLATVIRNNQLLTKVCGTPSYVAPEMIRESGYSFPIDVWAAGVIMFILFHGFAPFNGDEGDDAYLFQRIALGQIDTDNPIWPSLSPDARSLIEAMLTVDQHCRPLPAELLNTVWTRLGQSWN